MASSPLNLPLCTHRYFMMISYIGTKYNGSQRLVNRNSSGVQDTIQEALEAALEGAFARKRCCLTAASRTDKGVHALMNCYTLPLMDFKIPTEKLKRIVNLNLLKRRHEIVVNEMLLVPAGMHPRKSALSREYIYRIGVPKWKIGTAPYQPLELFQAFPASELFRLMPLPYLDMNKLEEAADLFRGVHDFKSFSYQPKDSDDTVRDLDICVKPANETNFARERSSPVDIYHIHFESRSFLHNQIRRLVGAMLSYASYGSAGLAEIRHLLDNPTSKTWSPNLEIAEPWGLYLSRIYYDKLAFSGSLRTHEAAAKEEVDLDALLPESNCAQLNRTEDNKATFDNEDDCRP